MNEIETYQQPPMFPQTGSAASGPGVNRGAVAIEQDRAIAEAQGQLVLAKKFPRDENKAFDKLMSSCALQSLAAVAFYNVPRAGGSVSGPSIRLAEEIARCYGNFEYGHRELSRDHEKSEVEVYAWDKENNNYSKRQLTVMHVRDTKTGAVKLRDQKDIDDKIANVASKQVRGRILALMPKWMVESAIDKCRQTLAGGSEEPIESRVRKMVAAYAKYGVTTDMLERYLGHKLAEITTDVLVDLIGIYNAIKEGAKPSEYFHEAEKAIETEATAARIAEKGKNTKKPSNSVESKPQTNQPQTAQQEANAEAKPEPLPEKPEQPEAEPEQAEETDGGGEFF